MPETRILTGDCLEWLAKINDNAIDCCVTSPPYFGLRDYGNAGQIGLEQTPADYVAKLVEVFREVRRVLKPDGTCWLNLGDSYANDAKWGGSSGGKHAKALHGNTSVGRTKTDTGLKPKDLIGIPWRVAFALQQDGWYLRQDIIWHKPNPMPESVRDRCTKAHEYLFLLSKNEKYYFDQDAILEPVAASTAARMAQNIEAQAGSDRVPGKINGPMKAVARGKGNAKTFRGGGKYTKGQSFDNSTMVERESHGNVPNETGLRNRRSVWTVTTKPFKEAHFATFPPDLIRPCILAGCREGGIVLDPFGGAGTTGLVAQETKRNAVLIELNSDYVAIAKRRLQTSP